MEIVPMLLKEMDHEAQTTRKMLERVPNDKYDWQPHEKSMTIRRLATHIAELPTWLTMTLTTDELDFAGTPYNPVVINNTQELMECLKSRWLTGGRTWQRQTKMTCYSNGPCEMASRYTAFRPRPK